MAPGSRNTGTMRFRWGRALGTAGQAQETAPIRTYPPPTFHGFAQPVPNLWEFWTSDGHYIYLKEMACVSIHFNPMSRLLELTFECIASEEMNHPVTLVLRFEEAEILQWCDDPATPAQLIESGSPSRIRGQVSDLTHFDNETFAVQLLDVTVTFIASSVACHARPGKPTNVAINDARPPRAG